MTATTYRIPAPQRLRLAPPLWARGWQATCQAWASWRADAHRRAEQRALAELDRRTLADLGFGDFASARPDRTAWQIAESARW